MASIRATCAAITTTTTTTTRTRTKASLSSISNMIQKTKQQQQQHLTSFSSKSTPTTKPITIPPPTWSVQNLKLTSSSSSSSKEPPEVIITKSELYKLANRAQINLNLLPPKQLHLLQHEDLVGIMRCTSLVCEFHLEELELLLEGGKEVGAKEMYDLNKGMMMNARRRKEKESDDDDDDGVWSKEEQLEAKRVLESVGCKLVAMDGGGDGGGGSEKEEREGRYFSVVTGRGD